ARRDRQEQRRARRRGRRGPAVRRAAAGAARDGRGGRAARGPRLLGLDRGERQAAALRKRRAVSAGRQPAVRGRAAVPGKAAAVRARGRARPAPRHASRPVAGARRHPQPDRADTAPAATHHVRPAADDPARGRGRRAARASRRARGLPAPRPGRRTPRGGGSVSRRYRPRGLYIWLALLTFLGVFAATAGARETLASRTQAVRQTVTATTATTRTITVSAAWHDVQSVISFLSNTGDPAAVVPPTAIDAITGQLYTAFNHAPVSLTPADTDWSAMTVPFHYIEGDLPGTGSTPVKVEITERQPLGAHVRLLSGRLPVATPVPAPAASAGKAGGRLPAATVEGVVTSQTAARLGLHAGSEFTIRGTEVAATGTVTYVTMQVTG